MSRKVCKKIMKEQNAQILDCISLIYNLYLCIITNQANLSKRLDILKGQKLFLGIANRRTPGTPNFVQTSGHFYAISFACISRADKPLKIARG